MEIGESPVWDRARDVLWFVDIPKPAIYSLDPRSRRVTTYGMPSMVGSLGLADHGKLIVALRSGVHMWDPSSGDLEFIVHPEPDLDVNRLNDGKVGPDGSFWVGSMHDAMPRAPTGSLYRIAPDGSCSKVLNGLHVSNGLAWSPDGRTMYHADSRAPYIQTFDFNIADGTLSNRRTLAEPDATAGLPDGAATDQNGVYWSAGVTAGVLNGFSPDGVLVRTIDLPVSSPTMPCFGGPDLSTLFITSLSGQGSGSRSRGTLLSLRMEVPGVPVDVFGKPRSIGLGTAHNPQFQKATR
ncbi:SMP-30/gluconolactonase/LRE family protein [Mesorhizobium sp.]|uniref:SMP-30/gluconolactonase/LRE family protein n=1 Tax=Mesorhizobium sp. TaxID=1871066 RepID=UPI00345B1ABC